MKKITSHGNNVATKIVDHWTDWLLQIDLDIAVFKKYDPSIITHIYIAFTRVLSFAFSIDSIDLAFCILINVTIVNPKVMKKKKY